jgi:hypothetical protein
VDDRTDRVTAEADAAAAPAGRFVWVSAGRLGGRQAGEVLAALVAPPPQPAK